MEDGRHFSDMERRVDSFLGGSAMSLDGGLAVIDDW